MKYISKFSIKIFSSRHIVVFNFEILKSREFIFEIDEFRPIKYEVVRSQDLIKIGGFNQIHK